MFQFNLTAAKSKTSSQNTKAHKIDIELSPKSQTYVKRLKKIKTSEKLAKLRTNQNEKEAG